jgi:hypothetical protein
MEQQYDRRYQQACIHLCALDGRCIALSTTGIVVVDNESEDNDESSYEDDEMTMR